MLLDLIWNQLTNGTRGHMNSSEREFCLVLYYILDWLENDELLNLMEAFPAMTGVIYWSYGAKYRWKNAIQQRRDDSQALFWHQLRGAVREQRETHEEAIRLRQEAKGLKAWNNVPQWRHTQREAKRRLLAAEVFELEQQLECVQQLQRPDASTLRWNRRFAVQIQLDIQNAIRDAKAEDDEVALEIPSKHQTEPERLPARPQLKSFVDDDLSISAEVVEENLQEVGFQPIERMILRDYHLALRVLCRLGLFYPKGYTHYESTYLADAITCRSKGCTKFIMSHYGSNELLAHSSLPSIWPGPFEIGSYIDLLIETEFNCGLGLALEFLLEFLPQGSVGVNTLRFPSTRSHICQFATGHVASLLAKLGVDLTDTTDWPPRDTPWHMAVGNPNRSFYDFLHQRIPHTINQPDRNGDLPITIAQGMDEMERAQWLIDRGAAVYPAVRRMLSQLCSPEDEWFLFYFQAAGARLPTEPWIHDVIEVLNEEIARQGTEERGSLNEQAAELIMKLKNGNGVSSASLRTLNDRNETPLQAATRYGLNEIIHLLQPPKPVRREHSSRYNLRKRGQRYNLRKRDSSK